MKRESASRATNGSVPDRSRAALLIIDMISDYRFADARGLLRQLTPVARRIAALKQRLGAAGIPSIYINDNFGRWRSDAPGLVRMCSREGQPGADIVRALAPGEKDYFICKPRHSGFYGTALETVLDYLGARQLVITGVSSHQCVLFTANDAYVRDYALAIPADCIAAPSPAASRFAVRFFRDVLHADTRRSNAIDIRSLRRAPATPRR